MSAAERFEPLSELASGVGRVVAVSGRDCVVQHPAGRRTMKRARSCLLAPRVTDTVLFADDPSAGAYVLAVLERDDDVTELRVDGPLRVSAPDCELRATRAIGLRAGEKVSMASATVELRANRADGYVEQLNLLGRRVVVEVERLRSVATRVDRLIGSLRERIKSSHRTVEELDRVRAGTLDIAAEGTARVHGRHALVGGEELVKINGAQVHLG